MVRLLFLLLFLSCGSLKTIELKDGVTDVPAEKDFFDTNYREKYKIKNIAGIDYNAIYMEEYYINHKGKMISIKDYFVETGIRFYENGCVNQFDIYKGLESDQIDLNPDITGGRGICYFLDNRYMMAMVTITGEYYKIGIYNPEIKLKGDTLFLLKKGSNYNRVLIKKPLSKKNQEYTANW